MISREEFDAELAERDRRSNERWTAINQELDRLDAGLARVIDQQRQREEVMERQGMSIDLLLAERGKS